MFLLPPNETQLESIKKEEFYQSADRIDEDVTQLIEWLTKQPHLPNITDRKWLTHFIISCKYNLQKSKKVIESYLIVRSEFPEFYGKVTQEEITDVLQVGCVYLFPKLTSDGNRIMCTITHPSTDDTKYDVVSVIKLTLSILDLQLMTEPMHGNIILYDLKHVRLGQFLAFTPTITKNMLKCAVDAFPLRIKAVHYINPPKFMSRVLTFFKMFLPNKVRDRIFVHDTLEELYEHIPKDILPDIYGGTCGNIDDLQKTMLDFMLSNSKWLEERPKADLSKRPDNEKPDEMEGTFKKLQID